MMRLCLIVSAVALLALQPLDAEAQDKNKNKSKRKLCADRIENGVPSRDKCPETKGANSPTPLQIGGTSFGSSGSPFQGGATGSSLVPKVKEPRPLENRAPMGGGLPAATPKPGKL